jgi:hypothetical protein
MNYVLVKGTTILGHYSGPAPSSLPSGVTYTEVPEPWNAGGKDIREYDAALQLRPLADRVSDALVTVPNTHKVVGEYLQPKTSAERVRDGIDARPKGQVVDVDSDGNAILRTATVAEQVSLGDMTQATADTINAVTVRAERDARLAGCDWTDTVTAQTRLASAELAAWQKYRQALRDVTKQSGFPSGTIAWPTSPDGVAS